MQPYMRAWAAESNRAFHTTHTPHASGASHDGGRPSVLGAVYHGSSRIWIALIRRRSP